MTASNKENYMNDLNNTLLDVKMKLPNNLELKRASPVRTTVFKAGDDYLKRERFVPNKEVINRSYSPVSRKQPMNRSYSPHYTGYES